MKIEHGKLGLLWAAIVLFLVGCGKATTEKSADVHVIAAETYYEQGQFRPAMIEVQNALQIEPQNEAASVLGAKIRLELGGTRTAFRMLESFVQGSSFDYYSTLAEAYIQSRKYNSALALLLQHAGKFPDKKAEFQVLKGRAYAGAGNRERSLEEYNKALELEPGYVPARLGILAVTASTGDFVTAEEGLTELLAADPENLEALLLLGAVQLRAGDAGAAEVTLSNAVAVLPTTDIFTRQRAGVLRALIDLLAKQGRSGEALVYQRALDDAFPKNQENSDRIQEVLTKIDNNELEQAEQLLNELYTENPDFTTGGAMLGLLNYVQGKGEEASTYFKQSVDPETAAEPILKAIAINYYRMNDPEQVVSLLEQRIEGTNDVFLISLYAMSALKTGQSEAGARFMQKAIAMAPKNGALRVRLARHYAGQTPPKNEQALSLLNEGVGLNPESWQLRVAQIDQLLTMGRIDAARQAVEKLPNQNKEGETLRLLTRAAFFQEIGEIAASRAEYQKVLSAEGKEAEEGKEIARLGLAQIEMDANNFDAALLLLRQLIELNPTNSRALTLAIQCFHETDALNEGVEYLSQFNESNDYLSAVILSDFLTDIGAIGAASNYVDILAQRNRSNESQRLNAKVNYARALEYAQAGDLDNARTALFSALASYPLNATLLKTLARLEIDAGQPGEAEKIIDDIRRRQGASALVLELSGDLAFAQQTYTLALENYLKAWSDRPSDTMGIKITATYQRLGDEAGLKTFVDRWRESNPASQMALINEVEYTTAVAIELYTDFLSEYPESPLIRNNLALLLAEAGSMDRALEMAKLAADQAPNNPSVLDTHGWLLFQAGKINEAVQQLGRAAALAPGNKNIANHLQAAKDAR